MSEAGTPFADMVREALKAPGATTRKLAQRGVDPETGYQLRHTAVWKIAQGEPVRISPALVRAVAAATGRPEREAQIAAAQEYVGLVADDPLGVSTSEATVVVAHVPGVTAADMPKVQELLRQWASREGAEE